MEITLEPRRITRVLASGMVLLVLAALPAPFFRHVLGHDYVHGFVPFAEQLFHLSSEASPPAWYSSSMLLLCAALLALIGGSQRKAHARYARHWTALAVIFTYISLDEAAALHERLVVPIRTALGVEGILYHSWVIPASLLLLLLAGTYLRFLINLPARTRVLFIAAGSLYVGGALGFELIEGHFATKMSSEVYLGSATRDALTYIEEILEMTGTILFVYALLDYLRTHVGVVRLSFRSPALPAIDPHQETQYTDGAQSAAGRWSMVARR